MSVLIDTGVLAAFLNRQDRRHSDALEVLRNIAQRRFGVACVADVTISELFTLLRARRLGPVVERKARALLLGPEPLLPGLQLLGLGPDGLVAAWSVFDRYREHGLSFADAALLHLQEDIPIDRVATFDRTLAALAPGV